MEIDCDISLYFPQDYYIFPCVLDNDEPFSISELLYNTSCHGKCLQSISVVILFITPKSQADDIDFYGKCRET